ncbi:LarC family nickel insertion protein [Clostridium sp. PL3]|uniref:LarC family nickel insertion protein n=1 Tax=Clostridium thailandense TaxID=2794346 RepID=A0A949TM22_9CLOT|nr:LarC family nickel insertion protein [Clostridium thailandense]
MKVLYYDCFCGISGDMNLAVLIDIGVPKEYLTQELSKLNLESEYEMKIERSEKLGITGTRVEVILKDKLEDMTYSQEQVLHGHNHEHNNEHIHEHSHHHGDELHHNENKHKHEHIHESHIHNHEHHHRNLRDIEEIISSSDLSDKVKKLSLDMFMKVAEAEAKIHGKDLYEVHFHEVGAIDSIVDMVGAAICLDYLRVDKIIASPVQVGGGFVKCAHGLMPVPAPATAEILKNIPINTGIVQFETTTPTGAAILAANVQEFTSKAEFSIKKVAYGIGHRDLEIPNVLRVYLGEQES